MPENLPPVLILCDDPGFSAAVESCWSSKPDAPAFQSADSTTWQQCRRSNFISSSWLRCLLPVGIPPCKPARPLEHPRWSPWRSPIPWKGPPVTPRHW